jgi:hypothetical protein
MFTDTALAERLTVDHAESVPQVAPDIAGTALLRGIPLKWAEALLWVRGELAADKFRRGKWSLTAAIMSAERRGLDALVDKTTWAPRLFHMGSFGTNRQSENDCGTACCIAGWMGIHMGMVTDWASLVGNVRKLVHESGLNQLFYPPVEWADFITPDRAVQGIDTWVATGKVSWDLICGDYS